jgi:hypothetical protein
LKHILQDPAVLASKLTYASAWHRDAPRPSVGTQPRQKKRIDDIDAQASCFDAKEKNGLVILMHSCTKKI